MGLNAEDDILQDFLVEAAEIVEQLGEQLVDLEQHAGDAELLNAIFRGFHTIKGGAGFLGIGPLVATCHCAEDVFNSLRQGQRVLTPDLMDAILQALDKVNAMMDALRAGESVEPADPDLLERLTEVNETGPADAQTAGPSPADDAVAASGELDPAPISDEITEEEFDALLDALHGNGRAAAAPVSPASGAADEMSDDEFEALRDDLHGKGRHRGKPVAANASADRPAEVAPATASRAGEANPGTGDKAADPSRIAAKSAQAEMTVRVDTQRLDNIMNLVGELVLVRNRLSTLRSTHANAELATAIANLDVVTADLQLAVMKTRIAQINGTVEIDSEPGHGSRITIKLPLTLAILPTLMVILDKQPFAVPLASVVEIFNLDPTRTNTVDGQLTVRLRDRALPLFYLRDWLVAGTVGDDAGCHQGHVVVVNVGGIQVGLVVDFLVGQEEVVIKPLGALLQGLEGMAGATITGDGKIALILDVPGLMRKYARRH
jgi:chemotaxis protein histidine kinase CheA